MRVCQIISIIFVILGAVLVILAGVLGFKVLPDIIHDQISEKTIIKNGTEQFDRFVQLPFPLEFKIHFFHIANPDEIVNGEKPRMEEKGPFLYNKTSVKENIVINDDLITYQQRNSYVIAKDGDDEEELTTLNIPLLAVFQQFETLNVKPLKNLLKFGYKKAFHLNSGDNPHDFFIKTKVKDFTFGGYDFCGPNDVSGNSFEAKAAKALCILIRLSVESSMVIKPDKTVSFSFLGKKNNVYDGEWTMNSGLNDIDSLGEVVAFNGKSSTNYWIKDSHCNKIKGGDSIIYPPFTKKSTKFTIFSTDICRTVDLVYQEEIDYKGVNSYRRGLTLDQLDSTLEINKCFCVNQSRNLDGQNECLPKGFMDMKPCLGAEILLSLPHFLWSDEDYSSRVDGLSPSVAKHETFLLIEPNTGSPLMGSKRMQFNMILRLLDNMDKTKMGLVKPAVIPIMWVDEGVEISDDLLTMLKDDFINLLPLVDILVYVLVGVGLLLLIGFGGYLCFRRFSAKD